MKIPKIHIVNLTDEELELWKWTMKNFKILNYARQIRLGSTTLHSDKDGKIKAKFEIWSLDEKRGNGIA